MSNIKRQNDVIAVLDSDTCDILLRQFDEEQLLNEKVVKTVFDTFDNSSIDKVLLKVIILNNRYSAGLTDNPIGDEKKDDNKGQLLPVDVTTMAEHIFNNKSVLENVDSDEDLIKAVNTIRNVGDKYKYAYSFATKYCSHHNQLDFPIYDSYVEKVLLHFKRVDNFMKFKKEDLKKYEAFEDILLAFKQYYNLNEYSLKDIDRYLWQLGKKFFPRKYKSGGK